MAPERSKALELERNVELDSQVVQRAIAGDRAAFQALVNETWNVVFLFIRQRMGDRERARDLTQDTYLQAFDKRGTLRQDGSFLAWLLTIASRKVIDSHRRRGTRPEVRLSEGEGSPLVDPGDSPARGAEKSEETAMLDIAMNRLDDLYRTVMILRYWSGLTPAQIARLLAEPEGTIRNRIFRAHFRLRELMESQEVKEEWQKNAS